MCYSAKEKEKGFTLVELMIVVAVSSIAAMGMFMLFRTQRTSYTAQGQVSGLQQNLRIALHQLTRDMRMVGYDPQQSGNFGITGANGATITFTSDLNSTVGDPLNTSGDGVLDVGGAETYTYRLYDQYGNGNDDSLQRTAGGQAVAENIIAIGFAYAFDDDLDGELDASAAGNTYWAYDSDGGGNLDLHLDTDNDGNIDNDDVEGGAAVPGGSVAFNRIRAIRVWVLAEGERDDAEFYDVFGDPNSASYSPYVVGPNWIDTTVTVPPLSQAVFNINRRHRLLVATVKCRNLWF